MSVRIDEAGKDYFARAIDLGDFLAILLEPGIAQGVFGRADGNDLPAEAQDRAIFDDAEFFEVGAAARARIADGERRVRSWPMLASSSGGCIFCINFSA